MRQVKKALKEQQKPQKQQQKRPKKDCPQRKASSTVTFSEKELVRFGMKMAMILQQMTSTMHGCKCFIQDKTSVPCKLYMHVQMYLPTTYKYI